MGFSVGVVSSENKENWPNGLINLIPIGSMGIVRIYGYSPEEVHEFYELHF